MSEVILVQSTPGNLTEYDMRRYPRDFLLFLNIKKRGRSRYEDYGIKVFRL